MSTKCSYCCTASTPHDLCAPRDVARHPLSRATRHSALQGDRTTRVAPGGPRAAPVSSPSAACAPARSSASPPRSARPPRWSPRCTPISRAAATMSRRRRPRGCEGVLVSDVSVSDLILVAGTRYALRLFAPRLLSLISAQIIHQLRNPLSYCCYTLPTNNDTHYGPSPK